MSSSSKEHVQEETIDAEPDVEEHVESEESYEVEEPKPKKAKRAATPRKKKMNAVELLVSKPLSEYEEMENENLFEAFKVLHAYAAEKTAPVQVTSNETNALGRALVRTIKSQLKWSNSCRNGNARFTASSMCTEDVFKATFKTTKLRNKFTKDHFFEGLGEAEVSGSARYSELSICSDLSVTFTRTTGVAKVSGRYGKN